MRRIKSDLLIIEANSISLKLSFVQLVANSSSKNFTRFAILIQLPVH